MKRWFTPRPDSLLGQLRSPLYMRWQAGMSLFVMIGVFQAPLATKGFSWHWMAPTLLSLPLYLYFYTRIYLGPLRRLEWHAGGIAVVGMLLWLFNPFGFIFLMMAGIVLAFSPQWRRWLVGLAIISMVALLQAWLLHGPMQPAWAVAMAGLFGGFSNCVYIRSLRQDAELRLSQGEVRRLAMLAERERIGRDLHDLLGHTLSLVTLKSELARRLALADPARAQREMEEVERVSRHALAEVRAAVTGMRRGDLAAELVSARLMLEASGILFDCAAAEGAALPEPIEAMLALVLREAVTNIHRHARATEARVAFTIDAKRFQMQISDNGCGGLAAHGNGISGMRERVRALGGQLEIDSPPRSGTRLTIELPLSAPVAAVAAATPAPSRLSMAGERA